MSCVICGQLITIQHDITFCGKRIYLPHSEQFLEEEITYNNTNICLNCAELAVKSLAKYSNTQL